jgi:ABC-2 type transport system ATP-binding protein
MLVVTKNVSKKFMGAKVLDNVTVTISKGDRIAMMGPNGAGKTTLVRAILGFYHIDSGEIRVNGFDPVKKRVDVLKNISFIPQLPPPVKLNIEELIMYVGRSSGVSKEKIFEESAKLLSDYTINTNAFTHACKCRISVHLGVFVLGKHWRLLTN